MIFKGRMRRCPFCREEFRQTHPKQKYCRYDHKNAANQVRIRRKNKRALAFMQQAAGSAD